jgi:hypothetical protein
MPRNFDSNVHIPWEFFLCQARSEKVNVAVEEWTMRVRINLRSPVAHGADQVSGILPGQSMTNVLAAKDRMWSPLFIKDVPSIRINHETRGLDLHEVPHDFAQQRLRHLGGQSDIAEEPLPSTSKDRRTSLKRNRPIRSVGSRIGSLTGLNTHFPERSVKLRNVHASYGPHPSAHY